LTPNATADLVRTLGQAGVDFVKDDELMANPPHSPLAERVRAVMRIIRELADATGRQLMFAFNISDQLDRMLAHYETVRAAGGNCVMVSLNSVLAASISTPPVWRRSTATQQLRHASPPALGMDLRMPKSGGWWTSIICTWWPQSKFCSQTNRSCGVPPVTPVLGGYVAMPIVSSVDGAGRRGTYRQTQTLDVMYLAGGGIIAHPGGPAAGVAAIRQAWEAAATGVPLDQYAREHAGSPITGILRPHGTRNSLFPGPHPR
jgi:ribulose-bisphosphate carboxylase large chain